MDEIVEKLVAILGARGSGFLAVERIAGENAIGLETEEGELYFLSVQIP